MTRAARAGLVLVIVLALPACSGGGGGDDETPCSDECVLGSRTCDGDAVRICGQLDADACADLSAAAGCPDGLACLAGRCVPACRSECAAGSAFCAEDGTVLVCGNYDADACLEGGGAVACPAAYRCEQGACVPAAAPCTDECVAGESACSGDATRACGAFDADACLDLGPPVACGPGETCVAGSCAATCEDECPAKGATECMADGVRTCGDTDADACLEWGAVVACPAGASCSEGTCSTSCTDECPALGGSVCAPDGGGPSACAQLDGDTCRDRATPTPCPPGSACLDGACMRACADACTAGASARCADGSSVETCGDFDGDGCWEWGGRVACPNDAACAAGACQTPCADECDAAGARACLAGSESWHVCGQYDLDACREWSAPSACASWELCAEGECVLGATPAVVVVNELVPDSPGADGAPGNGLFVELWGPPSQGLDGYELVGVNGADGAIYASIPLDGHALGADGYFLVAHPDGAAALVAIADLTSAEIDLQNGPDTVQVRWHGRVVDAVGYGTFGAGDVFAGEGAPAPAVGPGVGITRDATHVDTDDNAADFRVPDAPSPRAALGCSHECGPAASTRCAGEWVETCTADADADACLEWSVAAPCAGSGETCQGTACAPPPYPPQVVLVTPVGTLDTTQGRVHPLVVEATPHEGRTIVAVEYFANGALLGTTTTAPHALDYTVPALAATGSTITLQARAVDSSGAAGWSAVADLVVRNELPIAAFTATVDGLGVVTVDGSASTDAETAPGALELCWDWNGDGTCDTAWSTDRVRTHDYAASGTFTIGLRVRDGVGQVSTTTRTVTFADVRYVGGSTVTTETWSGTVIVTGDVTVAAGQTLTISPGTQVLFVRADVAPPDGTGDYALLVDGTLQVNGTASEPVIFSGHGATGKAPGAWDRIVLGGPGSILTHALVEYGGVGLDVRSAASLTDVRVRAAASECILLSNADAASLTDVEVTGCGTDGVSAVAGSTGVAVVRLSSSGNGRDGLSVAGGSSVDASASTLSGNTRDGASAVAGSTLSLSDSSVGANGRYGLSWFSTARGTVERCVVEGNGAEGISLRSDAAGSPSPVVNSTNLLGNAQVGSTSWSLASTEAVLGASVMVYGRSTSSTWTAPAGSRVNRVFVTYQETDSVAYNYVSGFVLDGAGATVLTLNASQPGAWYYLPKDATALMVAVQDTGYSSTTDSIVVSQVELLREDGSAEIVAITDAGTADLRFNYLGTFPDVLSRIVISRPAAVNVQGFVGVPYDATWSRGPYKAGVVGTETWSGTVYVTGDVTVPAGAALTVAAGAEVLFVDHDQDADGTGDFGVVATGRLDVAGTAESGVVFGAAGAPSGDAFRSIRLAGSGGDASAWTWATVRHGRDALVLSGPSSLANVTVEGGARDGVTLSGAAGASLADVAVSGAGGAGVVVSNADGATLARVRSEANGADGVVVENGATAVTVSRLLAARNGANGLLVTGGSAPVVTDSTLRENALAGARIVDSSPTLDYDVLAWNGGEGLRIEGTGAATADHSAIEYNGDAGVAVWSAASGNPTPSVQRSNVRGNATAGSTVTRSEATASTLSASVMVFATSTSATWSAPPGETIRRVRLVYSETDFYPGYVSGQLLDGLGNVLVNLTAPQPGGWYYVPGGTTSLRVRVSDTGYSSTTDTIVASDVETIGRSEATRYELTANTDAGVTSARYDFWTTAIGDVPGLIYAPRTGAVDFQGYVGTEYPSSAVGPRP